jgi:stearoyl-CoA desaturase (delta-9 desaturase)
VTGLPLFCLALWAAAGLGVVLGYHRMLAHRALRLSPWLARTLVTLGAPAGTPVQWAGNHRRHHAGADRPGDPHSPYLGGFLHAHVGWYLGTRRALPCLLYMLGGPLRLLFDAFWRPRTNQADIGLAADVAADPYYRWMSRPGPYRLVCLAHLGIVAVLPAAAWGAAGLAASWATLVVLYNAGDAIDSVGHILGDAPYGGPDQARNHFALAVLTLGDGWHADHHAFPWSARVGLRPGRIDAVWIAIRALRALGLATDVREPAPADIAGRLQPETEGAR